MSSKQSLLRYSIYAIVVVAGWLGSSFQEYPVIKLPVSKRTEPALVDPRVVSSLTGKTEDARGSLGLSKAFEDSAARQCKPPPFPGSRATSMCFLPPVFQCLTPLPPD